MHVTRPLSPLSFLLLAAWPALACVEPSPTDLGDTARALDEAPPGEEFPLEERVVVTTDLTRVDAAPGDLARRMIKLEPGPPGELTIDARDPNALVPVPAHGLVFDSEDAFVAYMIDHFNALPVEIDGVRGFELTVTTIGDPFYAAGWTAEGDQWDGTIVETKTPVLAMLGGLDGTITIRDHNDAHWGRRIDTPKYARGRCVHNQSMFDWFDPAYLDRGFDTLDCSGQMIMDDVFPFLANSPLYVATATSFSQVNRQEIPEKRVCDGSWQCDDWGDGSGFTCGPRCRWVQTGEKVTTSINRSVFRSGDGRSWRFGGAGPTVGNTSVFHMVTTASRDNFVCGHHVTESAHPTQPAPARQVLWDTLTADGVSPIVPEAERFLCADERWGR